MLLQNLPTPKNLLTAEAKVSGVHLVCAGAAAQDVLQDLTPSLHHQAGKMSMSAGSVEPSIKLSLLTRQNNH